MTDPVPATAGPSPLWYLTRGTGLVSLVLLTTAVVLGILQVSRWSSPRWPRFVTLGLHRNVSFVVLVVLVVHIGTAELDTFAPIGWLSAVVPFASAYRPVWLGLGTLSFDLLLAVAATTLARVHLGYRAWRAVHWAAYICWPLALVHGLGTGTDPRLGWVRWLTVGCAMAVVTSGSWRLVRGWRAEPALRAAVGLLGVASIVVVSVWALNGPLRPGWAKKAGTPTRLLGFTPASGRTASRPAQADTRQPRDRTEAKELGGPTLVPSRQPAVGTLGGVGHGTTKGEAQ